MEQPCSDGNLNRTDILCTLFKPSGPTYNPLLRIVPKGISSLHGPLLDYVWIGVIYSVLNVTGYGARRHQIRGFERLMTAHIASSILEIIWYHTLALSSPLPVTQTIPTAISLFTSASGLVLIRNLDGGRAQLTRPCYQVGGFSRLFAMPLAYFTSSTEIYQLCIFSAHAFIYARLLAPLVVPVLKSAPDAYAFCVVVASIFGLIDVGHGTLLAKGFLVGVVLIARLNAWTSRRIESGESKGLRILFIFFLGLTEVETIKTHRIRWRTRSLQRLPQKARPTSLNARPAG
ncbi:hypothetical protein FRB95_001446 [Tulasnella sp. JGI-2019a]|nr:hypothetical protein FRB95_001446 [Tulasnella sp. JGI-2019a]